MVGSHEVFWTIMVVRLYLGKSVELPKGRNYGCYFCKLRDPIRFHGSRIPPAHG